MFLSLRGAFRRLSFQNKLLLSYFSLIFIPLVVLSLFFGNQSQKVITAQSMKISEMYVRQTYNELDSEISKMVNQAQTVAQLERVQEIIETDPVGLSMAQQFDDVKELEEMIQRVVFATSPYQVRLFVDDRLAYSQRQVLTYPLSSVSSWVEDIGDNLYRAYLAGPYTFTPLMSSTSVELFSVVFPIRGTKDYNRLTGLISIDFEKTWFLEMLARTEFTGDGKAYLVRSDGTLACGLSIKDEKELDTLDHPADDYFQEGESVKIIDDTLIAASQPLWGTWRIVITSPVADLLKPAETLRWQLFLFAILIGIVVYIMALFYARYNSRRIKVLANNIKVVQSGNFDVNCIVDSSDEVGELQSSFNVMVRRIRNLMQEQYYLGKNLKDSELRILQAQINPHFLYNTLDLILWTAKNGDSDKVSDIVVKLSRFYRLSLSNGSDFVTVRNELEHVRLYVGLQDLRFQSKIGLEIVASDEVLDLRVMKLLLQPIVENSILHGIMNLDDREGKIRISVFVEGINLVLRVEDNGIGMGQEKVMRLMAREEMAPEGCTGGYGLHNITQRLRLYYGEEAKLIFRSQEGQGTMVEVQIPLAQCQNTDDRFDS